MLGANTVKLGVEWVEPCAGVHQCGKTIDAVVRRDASQPYLADAASVATGSFHIKRDEAEIAFRDHGAHSRAASRLFA